VGEAFETDLMFQLGHQVAISCKVLHRCKAKRKLGGKMSQPLLFFREARHAYSVWGATLRSLGIAAISACV
jgi:hypothetical protein